MSCFLDTAGARSLDVVMVSVCLRRVVVVVDSVMFVVVVVVALLPRLLSL